VVDVGPDGAPAHRRAPSGRVDADAVHAPEVDDDPVVDGREAGDAVAAAADGDRQVVAAGEADGRDHVRRARALDDERRGAPVVLGVPDVTRLLEALVAGSHHGAAHGLPKLLDRRLTERGRECLTHFPVLSSESKDKSPPGPFALP
jgi:hypothetical protein